MFMPSNLRLSGDGMEDHQSEIEMKEKKLVKCQQAEQITGAPKRNPSLNGELPVTIKKKEPKFVPYEPYKAAVTPIIPEQNKIVKNDKHKRNHSESKVALTETHIPFPLIFSTAPTLTKKSLSGEQSVPLIKVLREVSVRSDDSLTDESMEELEWKKEKRIMKEEMNKLREEKHELEDQFKIQLQVNGELKKLLVASLGEDMQSRVQFLSEDKAKLAQDIAHYSQLLLEDREELERLSIQCDIWRSKFLAISLMVDELARWKALLSRKYEESLDALQWMLKEQEELHHHITTTYRCLQQLQQAFDPTSVQLSKSSKSMNILQITKATTQLTEVLHSRLTGNSNLRSLVGKLSTKMKEKLSPAEMFAQKVLANKDNRIHGMELDLSREVTSPLHFPNKICHHHSHGSSVLSDSTWCRHCSGEMKVL